VSEDRIDARVPGTHWGGEGLDMMLEPVEPEVRRVVAERLGVGQEELTPEVSLADDLAVDSLDMVELGLALEDEFGITVPEHVLGEVRTYQHLVDRVLDLARAAADDGGEPPFVWARVAAPGRTDGALERAGRLTPYAAQTIGEDALRTGRGAQLEVTVPSTTGGAGLARVAEEFSWLRNRGVRVRVTREEQAA
jgi:acyl carrier protein